MDKTNRVLGFLGDANPFLPLANSFAELADRREALHQMTTACDRKHGGSSETLVAQVTVDASYAAPKNFYCRAVLAHLFVGDTGVVLRYGAEGRIVPGCRES